VEGKSRSLNSRIFCNCM